MTPVSSSIGGGVDGGTDVAIVGGGWAGFAAAVTLVDAGLSVAVFEASETLGGRARRVAVHAMTVDNGQHLMLGAYRETLALIDRVHRDDRVVAGDGGDGGDGDDRDARRDGPGGRERQPLYIRTPLRLVGPGRFALRARNLPAPWHMVSALLSARGCSIAERIAMVRAFSRWKAGGWTAAPATTVARLLSEQPRSIVERIWSPLCLAALNTPIEEASAQVYLNVLRDALASDRAASDMVIPVADLSSLFPEAAARVVESAGGWVHRGSRVRSIEIDDASDGRARRPLSLDTGLRRHAAGAVIVATAPWQAVSLLEPHSVARDAVAAIRRYRYEPICTVYLRFEAPIRLPFPMLQLDGAPGQWLFAPLPDADVAQIIAVVISADGPYRSLDREVLIQRISAQLERNIRGWRAGVPVASQVIVERRATHAATPFHAGPPAGALGHGLYIAGDHTDPDYPATLEAACRSGIRAARAVIVARTEATRAQDAAADIPSTRTFERRTA